MQSSNQPQNTKLNYEEDHPASAEQNSILQSRRGFLAATGSLLGIGYLGKLAIEHDTKQSKANAPAGTNSLLKDTQSYHEALGKYFSTESSATSSYLVYDNGEKPAEQHREFNVKIADENGKELFDVQFVLKHENRKPPDLYGPFINTPMQDDGNRAEFTNTYQKKALELLNVLRDTSAEEKDADSDQEDYFKRQFHGRDWDMPQAELVKQLQEKLPSLLQAAKPLIKAELVKKLQPPDFVAASNDQ